MSLRTAALALAAGIGAGAAPALALDLAMPAGATLAFEEASPAGSHRLATGPWADGALPLRDVEGQVAREAWQVPGEATTLELLAPLRAELTAQGFEVLLDCEAKGCGGFDFRLGIEVLAPPAMFLDLGDFRYLAAEREDEWASLLVSRSAGTGFVQVVRVAAQAGGGAVEGGSTALAPAPPSAATPAATGGLAARIEAEGRVVLGGLAFATGSADLAPGGEDALAELAAFLAADPSRRVVLVGHTDAQGSLDANVALSRRRAEAVAARLVGEHGAALAQVEAAGMGYLAPVATNLTPEGREANRRVEAVLLPP